MTIIVTENTPLIKELTVLLIAQDQKADKRRLEKIEHLQDQIHTNARAHITEVTQTVQEYRQEPPKATKKEIYDSWIQMYREAMELAKECSQMKKILRNTK